MRTERSCGWMAIVGILGWVMGYLLWLGGGSFSVGLFTRLPSGDVADPGGIGHAMVGTVILVALASLVGMA